MAEVLCLEWMKLERLLIRPTLGWLGEARVPPRGLGHDRLAVVVQYEPTRPRDRSSPLLASTGHTPDAPPRKTLPVDHARNLAQVLPGPAADHTVCLASL